MMGGNQSIVARVIEAGPASIFVPQPVLAEIFFGLSRLRNSKRKRRLEDRFALILKQAQRSVWSDGVSIHFGRIKADLQKRGQVIEDFDIAIAAHALESSSILVTANLKHMSRIGALRVENWAD